MSDGGLRVVDAVADRVGSEAAEDHAVGGADARAGEHRDGRLGHHRHVDGDAVAPLDPVLLERRREAVDLAVEIPVGQGARVAGLTFPDEGGLGAAGGVDVPVQAVVGDVELAADEPLGVGRLPLQRLLPRLEPVELAWPSPPRSSRGSSPPPCRWLALGVRLLREGLRGRKLPPLLEQGLDRSRRRQRAWSPWETSSECEKAFGRVAAPAIF